MNSRFEADPDSDEMSDSDDPAHSKNLQTQNPKKSHYMIRKMSLLSQDQDTDKISDPNLKNKRKIENLQVNFMCMVFMNKDLLVTGGSNGFLYIFKKGVLIEEQIGHLKSPILCIDKSDFHENLFVTGGQDGSVNLWEIRNYQDSNVIEKLFEYEIYKDGNRLFDRLLFKESQSAGPNEDLLETGKQPSKEQPEQGNFAE